jgi:toxin ParE1/3/4
VKLRVSKQAEADIRAILRDTKRIFGERQVHAYTALIESGLRMIAEDPFRPACQKRNEIEDGVRSLHLKNVPRHRRSSSHLIYFMEVETKDGDCELVVIGVLHERMEPRRRLAKSLRDLAGEV